MATPKSLLTSANEDLLTPEGFDSAFRRLISQSKPRDQGSCSWTSWFEKVMLNLAKETDPTLYCQNLSNDRTEWMKVDHVFVKESKYDHFPLIAVEHENGSLGRKGGNLPRSGTGEYIEWALWKSLSMRAHLSVLVAYPRSGAQRRATETFEKMAQGYYDTYGTRPNLLLMLGWWDKDAWDRPLDELYVSYKISQKSGLMEQV